MNKVKRLPHSVRKFIRSEKGRIRAQFFDVKKQEELISEIYKKAWGTQEKKEAAQEKSEVKVEVKKPPVKKEAKKPEAKKEKAVKKAK